MTTPNARTVAKPHPTHPGWYILPGGFETTEANVLKHGYTIETEAPTAPIVKLPPKPAARPAHTKPVAPPSSAVLAERARAQEILAMAPAGAEAEASKAIRTGTSVEAFRSVLTARAILRARQRADSK